MRKLYEIFKFLWIQKRIVAAATILGNTLIVKVVYRFFYCNVYIGLYKAIKSKP